MLKEARIGAVVFLVKDLEASRDFYGNILGLETELAESPEGRMLTAAIGNAVLVFFQGNEQPGRTPIVVFQIGDEDINRLVDRLVEQGVEIIAPVQHAPDGGLTADFMDPDGHILSLYKSAV